MDVRISVAGGDQVEEIFELREWLRDERGLEGAVEVVQRLPGEGEAVGSGGAVAALAQSLTTWLKTRRAGVAVTVKTKVGTVTVDASNLDPQDIQPLLTQIKEILPRDG